MVPGLGNDTRLGKRKVCLGTLHRVLQKGPASFSHPAQHPLVHSMDRMETGRQPSRRVRAGAMHLPGQAGLLFFQSKFYSEEEDGDPGFVSPPVVCVSLSLSVAPSFCVFPPEAPCHAVSACTNAQLALCTGESGERHVPVDVMATAAVYCSRRLD